MFGAVKSEEIERMLNLPPTVRRRCKVLGASVMTGLNLGEGLEWLLNGLEATQQKPRELAFLV